MYLAFFSEQKYLSTVKLCTPCCLHAHCASIIKRVKHKIDLGTQDWFYIFKRLDITKSKGGLISKWETAVQWKLLLLLLCLSVNLQQTYPNENVPAQSVLHKGNTKDLALHRWEWNSLLRTIWLRKQLCDNLDFFANETGTQFLHSTQKRKTIKHTSHNSSLPFCKKLI